MHMVWCPWLPPSVVGMTTFLVGGVVWAWPGLTAGCRSALPSAGSPTHGTGAAGGKGAGNSTGFIGSNNLCTDVQGIPNKEVVIPQAILIEVVG